LNAFIEKTAKDMNISIQYKNTVSGGNDAAALQKAAAGARVASISVPCRYIHSPYSLLSEADYLNAFDLLAGLIRRLDMTGGNIDV